MGYLNAYYLKKVALNVFLFVIKDTQCKQSSISTVFIAKTQKLNSIQIFIITVTICKTCEHIQSTRSRNTVSNKQ
jgi:hypothetical protein